MFTHSFNKNIPQRSQMFNFTKNLIIKNYPEHFNL